LIFIVSWFTHLTSRLSALGSIRFDLILVLILLVLSLCAHESNQEEKANAIGRYIKFFLFFSIITIPFVEWPGSVLFYGLPRFIKAIVFYFFTVRYIHSEKQFKIFMLVFLSCQSFRILEPLYLHVTEGYWGSMASMANGEFMNRLSGAPYDIVNPNGLAFIIITVFPFLYYYALLNKKILIVSLTLLPLFVWALVLTASRSGFVALVAMLAIIITKSKHKLWIIATIVLCACIAYPLMTPDQKDRYLSIVSHNTKNAATSEGRFTGIEDNLHVALRKPLFGYGLGTSLEANANFGHSAQPAHNLYAEVAQELGFIGLFIFLGYIVAIIKELRSNLASFSAQNIYESKFLQSSWNGLKTFFFTNLLFSLASYGLSSYEWYLIPALIQTVNKISIKTTMLKINEDREK